MAVEILCSNPRCRQPLACPEPMAGQDVHCPKCGSLTRVPAQIAPAPPPTPTSPPTPTPPPTPAPPPSSSQQKLGDYLLVRKLGQGGMGAVFEAIQTKLKRRVALKVLPQKFTGDPAFLERFQREAQAAAALNHPNVIQVYDIGEDRGHHYFAMEFVDGESVQKRLEREKKLPLKDALEIVEQVAKGLQYAHSRSIIHRDIKPDNIMLSKDGQVKLADLGLAKSTKEEKGVTVTGVGLGTPYYMAPEQAEDARHADHRADIYALGITLLHLLTGKRPFDGNSAYGIILAHSNKPLPTGEQLGTPLPPEVEAVIKKMCAKKPEERYQDYLSLLADLERGKAGQTTQAMSRSEAATATLVQTPAPQPAAVPAASAQASPAAHHRAARARPKSKGKGWVVGSVGAGVVLLGLTILFVSRSGAEGKRPPAKAGTTSGASSFVVPSSDGSGGARQPAEAGTTSKESGLVVPPLGGSGGEKPPAKASTTNEEGGAGLAGMFRAAEEYAKEHPEDFREIVSRFEKVKERGAGTEYEFKADDQAKAWRKKWEATAKAEFDTRKQTSEAHLQAGQFEDAAKLWAAFPEIFLTENFRNLVEQEKKNVTEAANSLAQRLSAQVEPLLAKDPESLTDKDLNALIGVKVRAEDIVAASGSLAESGSTTGPVVATISDETKESLKALLEKVDAALEAYKSAKAGEWVKAFDRFWDQFTQLIKDRKFDEAEALVTANRTVIVTASAFGGLAAPENPEPDKSGTTNETPSATKETLADRFIRDVRVLKALFARAEANLGQLVGKTIRVGGMAIKVTEVRGGKLIAAQGQMEMTVGPEKLEPEELLKLGVAASGSLAESGGGAAVDPKTASEPLPAGLVAATGTAVHQEALFHFFFGRPAKAKAALVKAKAQGVEMAFYEQRLAELEQGQDKARAESEAASLVSQVESAIKSGKVEAAESKLKKLEKDFGQTSPAKANLAKLRESLTEAQSREAGKKNLIFIPTGKFIYGEGAGQEIDLPAFYIGKYEVTNAEYDEFKAWLKKELEKGADKGDPHRFCYPGYLPDGKELTEEELQSFEKMTPEKRLAAIQKLGLKGGEPYPKNHDNGGGPPNHPAVNIDWYDAWAYCRWRGGRLPTEQEWEKAASWDPKLKRKRVYPWGDEFMAKWCNSNAPEDGFAQTCPVDEFPKGVSAAGCFNMGGNVWEWCYSWHGETGEDRVLRGGGWDYTSRSCRAASRIRNRPGSRSGNLGFRLALRSSP